LTDEEIAAWASQALGARAIDGAIRHAADCAACRMLLSAASDDEALEPAAPVASPSASMVGKYEVLEPLGAGGMGVVLRARDSSLGRDVALKMLRGAATGTAHRTRLLAEARALARIRHRNVVPVYECGEADGEIFIAMALIDGLPLLQWLEQAPTHEQRCTVALAIADGLIAVHDGGLVHRDIKPANVVISNDEAVLVDFGLARADDAPALQGDRSGTPAFLAPEVEQGAAATASSDQYQWWRLVQLLLPDAKPLTPTMARGLASTPAARYPDMRAARAAFAKAVSPRQSHARTWWLGIAGTVLVVAGVVAVKSSGPSAERCGDTAYQQWYQPRQLAVAQALQQSGADAARVAAAISLRIDDLAARTSAMCKTQITTDMQRIRRSRQQLCLAATWQQYRDLVDRISVGASDVRDNVDSLAEVRPNRACDDPRANEIDGVVANDRPEVRALTAEISALQNGGEPSALRLQKLRALEPRIDATHVLALRSFWHRIQSFVAHQGGEFALCRTQLAAAVADAQVAGDDEAYARALTARLSLAFDLPDPDSLQLERDAAGMTERLQNPAIRAYLLSGRAFLALGRGDAQAAKKLAAASVAEYNSIAIDAHAAQAAFYENLSSALLRTGDLAAAGDAIDRAVAVAVARYGAQNIKTWGAKLARAQWLMQTQQLPQAEAALQAILAWLAQHAGDLTTYEVRGRAYLCDVLVQRQAYAAAGPVCEQALQKQQAFLGADDPQLSWTILVRAKLAAATQHAEDLQPMVERALALTSRQSIEPVDRAFAEAMQIVAQDVRGAPLSAATLATLRELMLRNRLVCDELRSVAAQSRAVASVMAECTAPH
jgi:serine/threonine-protein kinase